MLILCQLFAFFLCPDFPTVFARVGMAVSPPPAPLGRATVLCSLGKLGAAILILNFCFQRYSPFQMDAVWESSTLVAVFLLIVTGVARGPRGQPPSN